MKFPIICLLEFPSVSMQFSSFLLALVLFPWGLGRETLMTGSESICGEIYDTSFHYIFIDLSTAKKISSSSSIIECESV